MNTLNKTLLALATGTILATTANAGNHINTNAMTMGQPYIGIKAGQFDLDIDNADKPTAYGVYGGYNFNNGFGIEAEYVDSEDADIKDGNVKGEYNAKQYGAYGTYRHHFANTGGLYGKAKLGVAKVEAEANYKNGAKKELDETGIAGALGLGYDINSNFSIEGEYGMMDAGDDVDANLWTIGAHLKF
ncbi:porin family protein [Psychrobacter sp. HD31]|uniref:porin family protein n=1 Tax=Psychrobacter sp. HD31 TaxID=3112003 RepID=UPI003DA4BA5D